MTKVLLTGRAPACQVYGGISRYVVELALGLNRIPGTQCKIDCGMYINDYLKANRRQLRHRGVFCPWGVRQRVRVSKGFALLFSGLQLGKHDVVHETNYDWRRFHRRKAIKIATFYDMINEIYSPTSDYTARISQAKRSLVASADRLIAISESTKRDMVNFLNVEPERIQVVYLATNIADQYRPPHASAAVEKLISAGPYLLWVGSREGYKNFSGFIEAFSKSRAMEEGVRILCAGGASFTADELAHWASLGVPADRVALYHGDDSDLYFLYRSAIGLVYATLYEGFGIPPLEAMACGCPVAASNASSIPEVVGNAAIQFDPGKREAIAAAVDQLVFDRHNSERLVQLGLEQSSKFSWDRCARETLATYQRDSAQC